MLGVSPSSWLRRLRPSVILLGLLALAPVGFIVARVAEASLDAVYWDEFDTALSLVLQLDTGIGLSDFLGRLFALANEHRMVTSRLMFAASYWLTGTINFSVISWLGNASLIALCLLLVGHMKTTAARVRLAVLLAALLFQLEHYENFLWSGSSIDHFQIVLLAGAAVCGVARGTRPGLLAGVLCAMLASFTLAHGMVTWFVGAGMLAQARRWRELSVWCTLGALTIAGFFAGFHVNTAQRFAETSLAGAVLVGRYWLSLLGAVPALGYQPAAPWLGLGLLAAIGWLAARGSLRRERIAFPLTVFAILALALIAVGRAAESGGIMHSRYYVLSALIWALVAFMAIGRVSHPRRPYAWIWGVLPALVAFNVAADRAFAAAADSWVECRDRAVLRFKQYGVDGRDVFALHPVPAHSTALLNEAERRGVYRMASVCEAREFPEARPSERIAYFVDEMTVNPRAAYIDGWAALRGEVARRGQVQLVLRSGNETHVFSTVTITRPDVAEATKETGWRLSGFRFARRRDRLPTGDFQVGLLIDDGDNVEYVMTAHRLRLVGDGQAVLAGE